MRKSIAEPVGIALLLLGVSAADASASATVDLLFVGRNGAPIAPTPALRLGADADVGDELTMAIRLRNDVPLTVVAFSLRYDLDGADALDVVTAFQWRGVPIAKSGAAFFLPISDLRSTSSSLVGSFQGASTDLMLPRTLPPAAGPFAAGYQIGTVVWRVKPGARNDGADIVSGILSHGIDGIGDAVFRDIGALLRFESARVDLIPEPGTAPLLGLGLAGIALARRRGL